MTAPRVGHSDDTSSQYVSSPNANKKIREFENLDMVYVGLDVHKKTIQVAGVDDDGVTLFNKKIGHNRVEIRDLVSTLPKGSKYVMKSSSV